MKSIRLYRDAPEWVRNAAVNHFGKGTVFLRPQLARPKVALGRLIPRPA